MTTAVSDWWQSSQHLACDFVYSGVPTSHTSWKVLDFFLKIPGPGKSWKITFGPRKFWKNILESHLFL